MPLGSKASFQALAAAYHSASSSSNSPASANQGGFGSSGGGSSGGGLGGGTGSGSGGGSSNTIALASQPRQQSSSPSTPVTLHGAAASGNLSAARSLLKSYASEPTILAAALAQPLHGVLPLHAAASGGNEHIVALLLSYGADANALLYRPPAFIPPNQPRNASMDIPRGITPASGLSSTSSLLPPPPAPGGPGEEGSTALHFAAAAGHRDVIATLLQYGAKPDAKDNRGVTPEMLASATGHNLCAEILRKAAAGPAIVPLVPADPSSITSGGAGIGGTSSSVSGGAGGASATANGAGGAGLTSTSGTSGRRDRTISNLRRPAPLEIKDAPSGPPPVTTPTRLKNQASLEHIAAGMKATFSGWNRTYSNSTNPFSTSGSGSGAGTSSGSNPPGTASKVLGRHASNPNLRSGSALLAESSAGESLPGAKNTSNPQASRKSSKDKIKERLKEPIRGHKDKGKAAAARQHSSSSAVILQSFRAGPLAPAGAEGEDAAIALLGDDDGSDQSDLGFSAATTPPAPTNHSQTFFANPLEAVPPLPTSEHFQQSGEDANAPNGQGGAKRRPSIPFLAAHPAQAVRAALIGSGNGTSGASGSTAVSPADGLKSASSSGKLREKWNQGRDQAEGPMQSPRGGSILNLAAPRRSESSAGAAAAAYSIAASVSGSGSYGASGAPPLPEGGAAASLHRAKTGSLSRAQSAGGDLIEELATMDRNQEDIGVGASGVPSSSTLSNMQRSLSSSTNASFKSDATSSRNTPAGLPSASGSSPATASSVGAAGSPRMQQLLLQASNGTSGSGGPPPSPSRLAHRLVNKRSFPNILRKFGSQSQMAQGGTGGGSSGNAASGTSGVSRQRSTELDARDRTLFSAMPPPLPPVQTRMRSRTTSKSRDRLFEHERSRTTTSNSTIGNGGATSHPMEAQRSSHSSDVAREAEDEVRELLSEENLGRTGGPHRSSSSLGGSLDRGGGSSSSAGGMFPSSASNGSAGSTQSSPQVPNFASLSALPPLPVPPPAAASVSGSDRESLTGVGLSSPRSLMAGNSRLAGSYSGAEHVASPVSMTPARRGERRPRASSAGSVARSSPLLQSVDVVSSREAAQQIFNRAELLLQSPAPIGKIGGSGGESGSGSSTGPASGKGTAEASAISLEATTSSPVSLLLNEEMSLADQLLLVGEALAREREMATKAAAATVRTPSLMGARRSPVVKPVSSEPRLSTTLVTGSASERRTVKASPSNDTLPSVQMSDLDSASPALRDFHRPLGPIDDLVMERSRSSSPNAAARMDFLAEPASFGSTIRTLQSAESTATATAAHQASPAPTRDDERWTDRFRRTSGDSGTFSNSIGWISRNRPSFSSNRSPESSAPSSIRMKLHGNNLLPSMPSTRTRSKSIPGLPKPYLRPSGGGGGGGGGSSSGGSGGTGGAPTTPMMYSSASMASPGMLSPAPPRTPDLRRLRTTSDANLGFVHHSGGVGASPMQGGDGRVTPGAGSGSGGGGKRKENLLGSAAASLKDLILLKDRASSKLSLNGARSAVEGSFGNVHGATNESAESAGGRSQSVSGMNSFTFRKSALP
ncbi:hypothetical protein OC834_003219 [Tilletia horrida]|nr:hypothetical protein OC834_003219 [Tilletia horrida]